MDAEALGGLGEVSPPGLPAFASRYRFFFHPVRYTSLGLAVLEAMTIGMPIVGLATTELVTVIENGVHGFIDTDVRRLREPMRQLLAEPALARRLGDNARRRARPEASLVEELGGAVLILPLLEDRSTTRMIDRIRGGGTGVPAVREAALPLMNGQAT